ncbi:uncharacterized protein LOC135337625 isoform X2 [Halichondria panicea]|uniref:uncharacterized protein LOC135337625 isoform X2 n=1 Tax=Halichondria panicea TaxID=6063 RepID=UPI00312B9677
MESYKKEKSSRQHMKIDIQSNLGSVATQEGLLLANPMACGDVSPGPGANNTVLKQITSPTAKQDVHFSLHNSTSSNAPTESAAANTISHSRTNSLEYSNNSGTLSRANSSNSERSSFREKSKSRPKSPSLFRFFVKGHSGSGSTNGSATNSPMTGTTGPRSVKRSMAEEEEEDYGGDASSNSDHEDPFSPRGASASGDLITNRHATESPKSPSVEQISALPRQPSKRHARNSSSGSGNYTYRDSGFSSERESVSQLREDKEIFEDARCSVSPGPLEEEFQGAGMGALESLHNQLQILVKQNSPTEEADSVAVYEEVIVSLSRQVEDLSSTVDLLRQCDQTLRFSLRLADQKTLEAESKLHHALERCQRGEMRYIKLSNKHQATTRRLRELEKSHQKYSVLVNSDKISTNSSPPSSSNRSNRSTPQRVQSQTQYDRRQRPDSAPIRRPSTAQGFNQDEPGFNQEQTVPHRKISSLSHTETPV